MKLLSAKEVAEYLTQRDNKPISARQVMREIHNGYIKAEKVGGRYVVKESALKNYVRRHPGVQGRNEKR